MPFDITLVFYWTRPPIALNYRLHKHAEAKLIAEVRQAARDAAARLPELGKVRVTMTWVVTDRRVRDVENPVPTMKALCDGLVDAGIVIDDRPAYMEKLMPVIEWRDKRMGHTPHFELRIERLQP